MGIGTLPALTGTSDLCDFSDFENTITGPAGIDLSLQEAGIAFGMTR